MSAFTQRLADQTLDNLRELYGKLYLLNPLDMPPKQRAAWGAEFRAVSDALMVLDSKALTAINAAFQGDARSVAQAIDAAESSLHGILDAQTILRVVGGILSTIGTIAALA